MSTLSCLALTACAGGTGYSADLNGASVPAGLERFYAQRLGWGSCAPFATTDAERAVYAMPFLLDCARLEVPLDYAAPHGRTAQLGVLRQKSPVKKIGSLVINPGGPGVSGMNAVVTSRMQPLANGPFDVVGFDPRGVGASTPQLDCAAGDDPKEDPAAAEAEAAQLAARCVEKSGGIEVIANSGTRDVVRDLDILRAALGDEKLTYVGFSYGTRIGAGYAEAFPHNVRAMVLDGAFDPAVDLIETDVVQRAAFQRAFDAFASACVARPGCPLGTDPAMATAAFQTLTRPLGDAPVAAGNRKLTYTDAIVAVFNAMYSSTSWPHLTRALAALAAGDGTELLTMAEGDPDQPANSAARRFGAMAVVNCLGGAQLTDRATVVERERRARQVAPFADSGGPALGALDMCAFLPVHPTSTPHAPKFDGLPPTLTVSTTGDPATPYPGGVALANALRGGLITVDGHQHTAFLSSACVDEHVVRYLRTVQLPPVGAQCAL